MREVDLLKNQREYSERNNWLKEKPSRAFNIEYRSSSERAIFRSLESEETK